MIHINLTVRNIAWPLNEAELFNELDALYKQYLLDSDEGKEVMVYNLNSKLKYSHARFSTTTHDNAN